MEKRILNRNDLMILMIFLFGVTVGTYSTIFLQSLENKELTVSRPIIAQIDFTSKHPGLTLEGGS